MGPLSLKKELTVRDLLGLIMVIRDKVCSPIEIRFVATECQNLEHSFIMGKGRIFHNVASIES